MVTGPNVPESGMLTLLHKNEVVLPFEYMGQMVGALAQKVFESRPIPALSSSRGGGDVYITIQANGAFDSPSLWENTFRTKIKPAMRNVLYGRST